MPLKGLTMLHSAVWGRDVKGTDELYNLIYRHEHPRFHLYSHFTPGFIHDEQHMTFLPVMDGAFVERSRERMIEVCT